MRAIKGTIGAQVVVVREEIGEVRPTAKMYINGDFSQQSVFDTSEQLTSFLDESEALLSKFSDKEYDHAKMLANMVLGKGFMKYLDDQDAEATRRSGIIKTLDAMLAEIRELENYKPNPLSEPINNIEFDLAEKRAVMRSLINAEKRMANDLIRDRKTTEELMGEKPAYAHSKELRDAIASLSMPKEITDKLDAIFSKARPSLSQIIDEQLEALIGGSSNSAMLKCKECDEEGCEFRTAPFEANNE